MPLLDIASAHGRFNGVVESPAGDGHRPADAEDAWERVFAFFEQHLGAASDQIGD